MENHEVWLKRVEAWRKSGLSSVAFAEGTDFTGGGLRHMAHLLRRDPPKPRVIRLARVVRAQQPTPPSPPLPVAPVAVPGAAIVVVVGGARVEVGRGASREVLAMVLEALAERSSE